MTDTTTEQVYAYRIEVRDPVTCIWDPEDEAAKGVESYDGSPEEYAREVLRNRMDDLRSLGLKGRWRVLVWENEEGSPDEVAAWAKVFIP